MLSLVGLTPQAAAAGADAVVRSRALVLDEVAGRQRRLPAPIARWPLAWRRLGNDWPTSWFRAPARCPVSDLTRWSTPRDEIARLPSVDWRKGATTSD